MHLYKRKVNRQSCDNHRVISLLSIAGKILARVLLNRPIIHLEVGLLPESQCGFRMGRWTIEIIFAARQLKKKMPRAEPGAQHHLCPPYQSIRHNLSSGLMEDPGGASVPRWDDGQSLGLQRILRSILSHKWRQAGLFASSHPVQHDVYCYASRCFPKQ